ncbi:MAG TPA: hypothetical protein VHB20_05720 [Verrucomicrobiae bacterium]|jgi:hypothetical protein|nr:hypothetical protein [Verrucomicrobiae bacterium]
MSAKRRACGLFLALLSLTARGGGAPSTEAGNDMLRFTDGSMLHGQLLQLDTAHGLRWRHPAALCPVDFQPGRVDAIQFAHPSFLKLAPTCHVRFANGDDVYGSLTTLDGDHVELATWFGDTMSVPRSGVQSVTFLSKGYTILYEGPYDRDGWTMPQANGAGGWHYRDSGFTANVPGLLGRDLKLSGSCTLEFDFTWSAYLGLALDVYNDTPDRIDYNNSSYLVQFTRGRVAVQRLRATAVPHNLGMTAELPLLESPVKIHVALQFNKAESTIDLSLNGAFVKQWKDDDGFNVAGSCVVFEQSFPSALARLSHLRVASWEGRHEPETAFGATNSDVLRFINHDKAGGKIREIKDGRVTVDLAPGSLTIPLERLTQIDFAAATNAPAETVTPWTVRAFFPGGGALSFQLENWSNNLVQGHSALFGRLAFQPQGIRELQFNLDRTKAETPESPVNEFEDADE